MRLIDADAIKIKPEYMHNICGVVMIRVEDITRILNDMPTIKTEPQWIPVSKRLPEEFCEVLACRDNGSIAILYYNPIQTTRYPQGFSVVENHFSWRLNNVIAWMPLPEPYQPKEKEHE